MIRSFADAETKKIWERIWCRSVPREVQKVGLRKLFMLNHAHNPEDLRIPPGNRLEKLKGNRKDQWSIRINNQYRICFKWLDGDAFDVEITDYH